MSKVSGFFGKFQWLLQLTLKNKSWSSMKKDVGFCDKANISSNL